MNKMSDTLKKFVTKEYKPYSSDLFSVFMYRNFDYCKENGYSAFMTPNVWMFIKSYENLRKYIIDNKNIVTLVQMAKGAFFKEATVDICSFVLRNGKSPDKGMYFRLEDFKGDMEVQKEKVLEAIEDKECGYFYEADESNFEKIPGSPVAHWVSDNFFNVFASKKIGDIAFPKKGLDSADNERFVRQWFETAYTNTEFNCNSEQAKSSNKKWFPLNSGGAFRKWYGNFEKIVNWKSDGFEMKNFPKAYIRAKEHYFEEGLSWTKISSSKFGIRYAPKGFIFDSAGQTIFTNENNRLYILGFMCTNIVFEMLRILNSTLNYQVGDIANLPIIYDESRKENIDIIVNENIALSKSDWDSFETSWDFKRNPLI